MNNNNFLKKHLITIVVITGIILAIIITYGKKDNNILTPPTTSKIIDNLESSTKNKIAEKQQLIKKLEEDFMILKKNFEIKKNDSNKYYDSTNELQYLESDLNMFYNYYLKDLKDSFTFPKIFNGINITKYRIEDIIKKNYYENEFNQIQEKITAFKYKIKQIIPKFKITQDHYDKVKVYITSKTDDKSLLPKEISPEEKIEIDQIREMWKQYLNFQNQDQANIDKYQEECDNFHLKIQEIKDKFPSLESTNFDLQQKIDDKQKKINVKQEDQKQFKYLPNQPESIRTTRKNNYDSLQAEISKLQDERNEIMHQITQVSLQIANLEADQTMYENMLSRAIKLRDSIQCDYDETSTNRLFGSPLSELQKLYEITPSEG
ncbi:hypothetical protein CWO85_02035 [Candidatus Phytoplasma ziziphi]|uniref:Effector n=1 Tax=Ziziphus jujuba witches'-broom phytoplasma TaxID=135727 RepID=A0A660HMP8_ZIZJU|nr:hypothetical protein [Candidatus Phytoplasma ziziphi]AYJ01295.1 hypothetical protein CWO85_02035 [Candidatus Phytoplasma ziziphi]